MNKKTPVTQIMMATDDANGMMLWIMHPNAQLDIWPREERVKVIGAEREPDGELQEMALTLARRG